MSTIQKIQAEIVEDFGMFDDWMQKYEYLIDLGNELAPIKEQYKTEDNLIKGCQSRVWLHAEHTQGKIIFTADSDAIMTKGIVAILINVLSNQAPKDIATANIAVNTMVGDGSDTTLALSMGTKGIGSVNDVSVFIMHFCFFYKTLIIIILCVF